MIQLLVIKSFFKKVWTWFKHNWKVPFIIAYTLVLWILFRRSDKAREVLDARAESYKSQIDAINNAHKEEVEKRDEILKKYTDILSKLETEYAAKEKELGEKKKKEIKKLVEKYYNSPDSLAREIADKFGFDYEENN